MALFLVGPLKREKEMQSDMDWHCSDMGVVVTLGVVSCD